MNDQVRAGIISLISSAIPVGQLLGLYELTSDEISIVMLFVTNTVSVAALLFKHGQQAGPSV